jgi:hypothetical protein
VIDKAVDRLVEAGYATKNKAGAVAITQAGRERRDAGLPEKLDLYLVTLAGRAEWKTIVQEYLA